MIKAKYQGKPVEETVAFWKRLSGLQRQLGAANSKLSAAMKRTEQLGKALVRSTAMPGDLDQQLLAVKKQLEELNFEFNGHVSKQEIGEKGKHMTVGDRLGVALLGTALSTYGPTPTHVEAIEIAESDYNKHHGQLKKLIEQTIPQLEQKIYDAGAPWIPGADLPNN